MKKALLSGSSGLAGSHILTGLLNSDVYEQVTIVVRPALDIRHQKLLTIPGDYNSLTKLKDKLVADDVFIALGTTKKQNTRSY